MDLTLLAEKYQVVAAKKADKKPAKKVVTKKTTKAKGFKSYAWLLKELGNDNKSGEEETPTTVYFDRQSRRYVLAGVTRKDILLWVTQRRQSFSDYSALIHAINAPTGDDKMYLKKIEATLATANLKVELVLKSGETYPAGAKAEIDFSDSYLATVKGLRDGEPIKLRYTGLAKYFAGFTKPPSASTMQKWMMDGVAKSVTGKRCEPDGHGDDGSPSWLLALGYI